MIWVAKNLYFFNCLLDGAHTISCDQLVAFLFDPGCAEQLLQYFLDGSQQIVVLVVSRQLWIFRFDGVGALEQESGFACLDHADIVVAVAAGDGFKSAGLQRFYRSVFGFLTAHFML